MKFMSMALVSLLSTSSAVVSAVPMEMSEAEMSKITAGRAIFDDGIRVNRIYIDDVFDSRGNNLFTDVDVDFDDGGPYIDSDKGADRGRNSRGADINE